jgi:hypothetical protein
LERALQLLVRRLSRFPSEVTHNGFACGRSLLACLPQAS